MMLVLGLLFYQLMIMTEAFCSPKLDNGLMEDLLSMLIRFKGSGYRHAPRKLRDIPAFTASLSAPKSVGGNEILKFDKVWTNNGNHYDPSTGVFQAPIEGLYQVSATVMSVNGKNVLAKLWQNETKMVGLYPGTGYSEATVNMVLHLKKGDKVTVRGINGDLHSSSHYYSTFSAYLIS
ncbi:complement C1q-like protein 2 [Mytilus californianus]|uniref:complement C1q-like protein 2 n=1 Tax=Mytilus californianus TaxID=6549 RepID=UPI0022471DCE|nr:complement C1q-like protein 2 [Mytilus californianus]